MDRMELKIPAVLDGSLKVASLITQPQSRRCHLGACEMLKQRRLPLARISKSFPCCDGKVRAVDLDCQGKIFRRSHHRLVLLIGDQPLPPGMSGSPSNRKDPTPSTLKAAVLGCPRRARLKKTWKQRTSATIYVSMPYLFLESPVTTPYLIVQPTDVFHQFHSL